MSGEVQDAVRRTRQPVLRPRSIERLPLVTIYLTERCNSRCITCDHWRHGRADMTAKGARDLLPSLAELHTEVVLVSGGEPLLNPEWATIAELLRTNGLKLWLLTSGLSLAKHAVRVAELFDAVTVSLDGADRETYRVIRGLDAFDRVSAGIRDAVAAGVQVSLRCTVQRANYTQLPRLVAIGRALGARQVSFVAADVSNPYAFGRRGPPPADVALRPDDLPRFASTLDALEREHGAEFASRFIAESPEKLRRMLRYFAAVCGLEDYPPVRCNAPEFSAVVDASGLVHPCFFIKGPLDASVGCDPGGDPGRLGGVLNSAPMRSLREAIAASKRPECRTCVCSLWRDPQGLGAAELFS